MSRTPTSTTSTSLTPHQLWTRSRGTLLLLALLLTGGILVAAVQSADHGGRLDPRSADPAGSRAVAELLQAQGVTLQVTDSLTEATTATGADTTLLVTTPDLLTPRQQSTLYGAMTRSPGRTVLLTPGSPSLPTLAPGIDTGRAVPVSTREAGCALPAATRAGSAELGGERYRTGGTTADSCYLADGLPTLVRLPNTGTGTGDTVLLGSAELLTNEHLAREGNAALALHLLGSRPHLVWYLPSLADAPADATGASDDPTDSFLDLIPSGWLWGTLQLALAAVLAAVWRGRRLGALVPERLPVAIRASETTEGRARLYRKTDARDRAATVLRTATRDRLAPLLGVPGRDAHSPELLLPALSARLPANAGDHRDLLFGPVPTNDAALVRLADQLDALEREVRTS
ncbi:DUF4350 domain-containing protein [Streptomyces sp. NPDC090025]|uniref:DUF4350 domain-containing protein n=1 Tax=Streptomyces sp. NPDC090025 TaxID=3365922 RepID=UPI00383790F9